MMNCPILLQAYADDIDVLLSFEFMTKESKCEGKKTNKKLCSNNMTLSAS